MLINTTVDIHINLRRIRSFYLSQTEDYNLGDRPSESHNILLWPLQCFPAVSPVFRVTLLQSLILQFYTVWSPISGLLIIIHFLGC